MSEIAIEKKLYPVPASGWFNTGLSVDERGLLVQSGIIPLNDVFCDCWDNKFSINLLYGGYGSGKSVFICLELLRCALESRYFRCYFGRKVLEDVRGSVHATFCDVIEDFGLQRYFKYSRQPNGSMDIVCYNGNTFHPFGASDIKSLKSIKDPTHFFGEELDQFSQEDFQIIYPRLRTTKALTQFYGAFNTSAVFDDHWIKKMFFGEESDYLKDVSINKLFCNYTDNYFIDQADYYNKLKLAAAGNKRLLDAIANGAWGVIENDSPWLYNFDYERHCKPVTFNPQMPVYLSFDFNVDPVACVAFQYSEALGSPFSFLHFIEEFVGSVKLEDLCQRIKSRFPQAIFFVTGDRSGKNEDLGRNQTLYQIIAASLGISTRQLDLLNFNLEHADSRQLCNTMLYHYPNLYINPYTCPVLVADMQKARCDLTKPKPSHLLKDREQYKMDAFDAFRYALQRYFLLFAKTAYFNVLKQAA